MSTGRTRSGPPRRALGRWSARLFRREWRQQLLVLSLLTAAVAIAVSSTSMVMNASAASGSEFGAANSMARLDVTDEDAALGQVEAARQRFGAVEVITHQAVAVPGSANPVDLRSQDPSGGLGRPLVALRAGRYPTGPEEVALTDSVVTLLGAHLGDTVELGGVERTLVGRVENPSDLADEFALLAPDERTAADSLTLLFDSDHGRSSSASSGPSDPPVASPAFDLTVMGRGDQGPIGTLVFVAVTLVMALVGLIAAAGFVVVAQRRQRQLGLLAAIGATEQHLRFVMLANGVIVGATAAVVGGAVGVAGWVLAAPAIEVAAGHRIGRFDLPWGLIAATLVLAVVTATAASWWPARSVARLPVMVALSGRPARPSPVHRSLTLAVALAGAGMVAVARAQPASGSGHEVQPLLLIGGIVGVVLGVVFAAPAAIRVLAVPARRLPFAPRLALRDLVRHQARAAAALAAITLALGVSVTTIVIAQANAYRADEGNLSSRQLLVRVEGAGKGPDADLHATRLDQNDHLDQLDGDASAIASGIDGASVVALDEALNPSGRGEPVAEVVVESEHSVRSVSSPVVATPEVLRHLGIDPASIDDGTDLITSSTEDVQLFAPTPPTAGEQPRKAIDRPGATVVQRMDLPAYTSAPSALITEGSMARNGWVAARAGWLIEAPGPLHPEQVAVARATAAPLGLTIETRTGQDALATVRVVATGLGALLALAIVAMTIGLIRSESAADLRTLTATGAGARTRRALAATTAGSLTVLGVALGTVGAYLALGAAYHSDLGELVPLPAADLLLLAVGLPVLAAAAGWLLAGREPRSFSRQALA